MLIYHPAFDAYHCVFRMLTIADAIPDLEIDKARLLDFYLLFPGLLQQIRLPPKMSAAKRSVAKFVNEYRDPISAKGAFRDMKSIQDAALRCIAASNLIARDEFDSGRVVRSDIPIPDDLLHQINLCRDKQEPLTNVVLKTLAEIPLLGADGLKARTGLMEFRYDVV